MNATPLRSLALTVRSLALAAVAAAASGCASASTSTGATPAPSESGGPRIVQPGAPGQASRAIAAAELAEVEGVEYTEADIRFMQGMIPHHAQALEMTDLVRRTATSEAVRQMGLRMEISQRDEIILMERWLTDRAEPVRMEHEVGGATTGGLPMMPGMLTPEQMEELATATGNEFDRLFLEYMIQHHRGAIVMVDELFGTSGAGQESLIFKFASDVGADQTMEIERMRKLLNEGRW